MKKLLLWIMASLVIMIGCSDNSELQDDMNYTIETSAEMVEKYMQPLMNFGSKEALKEYQNNIEAQGRKYDGKLFRINQTGIMKILPSYDYGCKNSKFFVDIIGTGYATGLGKHTVNISYCSFDGLNSNDIIYGLLTFNNGDKIYSELIYATSPDENGNWQQYWKIYDGTGRFYNVVGLIGLKIVGDFTHLTWINSGHGILIYRSSIY